MFTGIVEALGRVKAVEISGTSGKITVEPVSSAFTLDDVAIGDSIAVSGVCLTVTAIGVGSFTADVSAETLKLTTLGRFLSGSAVNLEKALTLSKPLGGHLVSGHVDGVGTVKTKKVEGENVVFHISVDDSLAAQVVKKGSVAVDGISLTVAALTPGGFTMAIVPHTMKATTISDASPGDKVNVETDIIGKYVQSFLAGSAEGAGDGKRQSVTESFLEEHGFKGKK